MGEFTIGGVLRRAAALFGAHPALITGLWLVLLTGPQAIGSILVVGVAAQHPGWAALPGFWYWIGAPIIQIIITQIGVDDAGRRPSRPGDLAGAAARYFFPVLAITFISALAVGLASILLLVPGVMLLCRWYVAVPAEIAERAGIIRCLGRSATLTRGDRWRVLGLILVAALIGGVMLLVISFGGGVITGVTRIFWPSLVGQAVGMGLFTVVSALVNTAAYFELREIKEGALSQELVSVFE